MIEFKMWIDQNCTRCSWFEDIWLRTDLCIQLPQSQEIRVKCGIYGEIRNNKLYVCDSFSYDSSKLEVVYEEKRAGARHKRFFVRIGSLDHYFNKEFKKREISDIDPLIRDIYDLVCKVYQEYQLKPWMKFVIERMHLDRGVERQTVWRSVMQMIELGYLVREQLQGEYVLSPPSAVLPIAEVKRIGKGKVVA